MKIRIPETISKGKLIKIIIVIIAVLAFFTGAGQKHLSPFRTSIDCNDVMYFVEDENGGAMVDRTFQTVYFFNSDHQILAVTDMTAEGENVSWITGLDMDDGHVNIYECKLVSGGAYFDYESIQAYTLDGKWINEVYCIEYNDYVDCVTVPHLTTDFYDIFDENASVSDITLNYSVGFFIKNLVYWLSLPIIALSIIFLIIEFLRKKIIIKHRVKVMLVLAVLGTVSFYSMHSYNLMWNFYENTVSSNAEQLGVLLNSVYKNDINEIFNSGDIQANIEKKTYSDEFIDEQANFVKFLNANDTSYNYFATLFILDPSNDPENVFADGNKMYSYLDSRGIFKSGEEVVFNESLNDSIYKSKDGICMVMQNGVNSSMFDYSVIYDDNGKPVAMVRVVSLISNIIYNETSDIQNTLINILAAFILVYVLYILAEKFYKDIRKLKNRDKTDSSGRILDMSGIYMFVFQIASTIDEVIMVYVAKSLCAGMSAAMEATMIALPLAANSAGRWVGTFLAGPVIRKFGERKTGIIASAFGIGLMFLMAFAVIKTNIYMLIAGKFLQGAFISGFLYVISDTMPLNAENEEEKKSALNHSQLSMIGAEILAALAGGYISQYIGYEIVYFAGAAACILMLVLTILTFRRKNVIVHVETKKEKISGLLKNWTVFFKRPMLIFLICYLIPYTLIGGYKSYIFPLYTAEAGISVLLLSNISVYGKAVTFLLDDIIKKYSKKLNPRLCMLVPVLVFSVGLLYFILSPSVYWAIMLYFAIGLARRMASVGQKLYIAETAASYHTDGKLVQSNFYTIEAAVNIMQSPVLSAFLSIGMNVGSAIVGAISCVMFAMFGLFHKKRQNHLR